MSHVRHEEIMPGLWKFTDTCNVYVIGQDAHAIAIDFGSGAWLDDLPALGITRLEHVFLTHHHDDQCAGLSARSDWPFTIHAPVGEGRFLDPAQEGAGHRAPWFGDGCPASYAAPKGRIAHIVYDMAGFGWFFWHHRRLRFYLTPGHGPHAISVLIEHQGKGIVCCGDAAHAGATVWEPYHLEWDHWTGTGALAAWEGIERLAGLGVDVLCPAHGPVIEDDPRQLLRTLSDKLLHFYRAKGQISPGEADRNLPPEVRACGAFRYLPHLYQFGCNGYLLVSETGEALVVDPTTSDLEALAALCADIQVRPTAMAVSHYHFDHCDAIPAVRDRYGAVAWLHPRIADAWLDPAHTLLPWLLPQTLQPFSLWPDAGDWQWNEYTFRIAPWPGQTWWHCAFMTEVDAHRVLFAGDSFQPAGIWNGTGGFCAYNNSRFLEGYVPSARLALAWQPEIVAAGHTNCYAFAPAKFEKILAWAQDAHDAVLALCPHGDLERDYYAVFARIAEDGYRTPGRAVTRRL
jgi:glyoxylase-like metal-dependent hydrolase (beta-lactamase superfamily II)